jgi:hypothetical protein
VTLKFYIEGVVVAVEKMAAEAISERWRIAIEPPAPRR